LKRSIWALLALVNALMLAPPAAADFDCGTPLTRCWVQLDNSGRVWFQSYEKLTEDALGDGTLEGGVTQIFQRVGNQTLLVSKGPNGQPIPPDNHRTSAWLLGVSPDGERVYMTTQASLVPEDVDAGHGDNSNDGYVLSGGNYTLVTTGVLDGGANPDPYSGSHDVWASGDGRFVYFETGQRLVPEDWDGTSDIYQRSEGQTRLVTIGPDQTMPTPEFPNPQVPQPRFLGASPDGSTAYFATSEHLTADDTGKWTSDIFAWSDGVTRRLTRTLSPEEVPGEPWEQFSPYSFAGAGEEGSIYFSATARHVPGDTDADPDVYRARADGALERVIDMQPGSTPAESFFQVQAVSRDGSRLFLNSGLRLVPADQDDKADIYMWSNGSFELISSAGKLEVEHEELHLCSISGSGRRAYFQTWGSLSPEDTDAQSDVYEWSEGQVRLVSPSSGGRPGHSFCSGISPNGRFVAFTTWEELVPGDNDVKQDVYVIDMGTAAASASASARRPQKRRLRLVTAESIAPRMGVATKAVLGKETIRLRLRCPKAERSGPCRGRVRLVTPRRHRLLAAGSFRIAAGRKKAVLLRGKALPQRATRALARVRGADMLGNRRTVSATVRLRKGGLGAQRGR
jgi:hypothetical protein